MKQNLHRLLNKTQPRAAIPTKIRRIRRLLVNIEADGCPRCSCSTNRPNGLVNPSYDPWAMAKCQQMEMNAAVYAYALNHLCCSEAHWNDSEAGRLSAGLNEPANMNDIRLLLDNLENEKQANLYYQPRESLPNQSGFSTNQAEPTYSMCGSVGPSYSQQFSESNMNCEADIRKAELNTLTNMLQQTMAKLDSLVMLQTEKQAQVAPPQLDMSFMPQLNQLLDNASSISQASKPMKTARGKRLVKVMPVQPLVIMPAAVASQATTAPAAPAVPAAPVAPVAPVKVPYTKYRTRVRKKRYKAAGTNTTNNSSASLTSASQVAESASHMKDTGTTMWCPRSCCKHCCGIVTDSATSMYESTLKTQQMEAKNAPIVPLSIPIQLTVPQSSLLAGSSQLSQFTPIDSGSYNRYSSELPLSSLLGDSNCSAVSPDLARYTRGSAQTIFIAPGSYELPPPKSMLKNRGRYYEKSSGHEYGIQPQQTSVATEMSNQKPTSQDLEYEYTSSNQAPEKERSRAGKLTYAYTEEEEEQQLRTASESQGDQSSEDEWYRKVSKSLAELEEQQSYFSNMSTPVATRDKVQQTDCIHKKIAPESCATTTDKCVCTSDLQAAENPIKIVAKARTSSLKSRRCKPLLKPMSTVKTGLQKVQTQVKTQSNPLLQMTQSIPKYRVLKSMSEALPNAGPKPKKKRVYTRKELARYQKLLELVEHTEEAYSKIYKELKGNPMNRDIPFRPRGGAGRTPYPTSWTQLENSPTQQALLE